MTAFLILISIVISAIGGIMVGFYYWQLKERRARHLSQEFDEVYRRITGRN